jgi:hypothetical protein
MRLNLNQTRALLLAAIGVLTLSFQNCSGVSFQANGSGGLNSKQTSGMVTDDGHMGAAGDDATGEISQAEEQESQDWLNANCIFSLPAADPASAADQVVQDHNGPLLLLSVRDLTLVNSHGPVLVPSGRTLDAQAVWGPMLVSFNTITRILNQRGAACVRAHTITELQNLRGALKIIGTGDANSSQAEIDHIVDVRGAMSVSNAHIRHMENTRGALLLDHVVLDELIDHDGAVMVTNGDIKSLSNIRGAVVINGVRVQ